MSLWIYIETDLCFKKKIQLNTHTAYLPTDCVEGSNRRSGAVKLSINKFFKWIFMAAGLAESDGNLSVCCGHFVGLFKIF